MKIAGGGRGTGRPMGPTPMMPPLMAGARPGMPPNVRANFKYTQGVRNANPQMMPASAPVMASVPQPQQAVYIKGQEPLTTSMLAAAPPNEQKQMLGERLYPLIDQWYPHLAGKITGMLLEIDNSELVHMLEHQESLKHKVEEAVAVLQAHKTAE